MKNVLKSSFVGLSMILSGTAVQAHQFSELNLKMHDNGAFSVMLDGRCAGENVSIVEIGPVRPGPHELKVMRYFFNPWNGSMVPKVIFSGCVTIPPRSKVYSLISCNNCYQVVNVYQMPGGGHGGGNWGNGYGSNGWTSNGGGYYGDESGGGHGWDPEPDNNGWNGGYNGPPPMNPEMFRQLKSAMEARPFGSSKLEIAQQAMSMNYFTSAQVSELMGVFTFDSDKLTFAKNAYSRTIDKQNYFMVNNGFTFSSSASELNEYIKHL
jgi:hypothetical protein